MISQKDQAHLDFLAKESSIPLWFFYLIQGILPTPCTATTFTDAEAELKKALPKSGEQVMAAYRLIELATSTEEAMYAAKAVSSINEKLRFYAHRHWNQLAYQVVQHQTDPDVLIAQLTKLLRQSTAHELAISKLIEHALNDKQFELVHEHIVCSPSNQKELLGRWLTITNHPHSLEKIYHYSLHGSEIQGEAWEKWNVAGRNLLATAESINDIRHLLRHLPSGGTAMEYAAERALKLRA